MVGNRFEWDSYDDENLVLAYDGVRTYDGLMKDMSKNGLDGFIYGTGSINKAYPLIRAKKTYSMDFVSNVRVQVNDDPRLYITRPTMIAWFNADEINGRGIISKGNSLMSTYISYSMYLIFSPNICKVVVSIGDGAGGYNYCISEEQIVTGLTYFAAGVVNDNFVEVYLNGELSGRAPRTINPFDDNQVLLVGRMTTTGSTPFNGRIDAVRLYNIALTPAQILKLYRSGGPRS